MRITVSVCISFLNTFTPHNMTTYTISNNSSQLDSRSHPPPCWVYPKSSMLKLQS